MLAEKKPLPVEIKYGKIETKGILAFMRKFKVSEGVVTTNEKMK